MTIDEFINKAVADAKAVGLPREPVRQALLRVARATARIHTTSEAFFDALVITEPTRRRDVHAQFFGAAREQITPTKFSQLCALYGFPTKRARFGPEVTVAVYPRTKYEVSNTKRNKS